MELCHKEFNLKSVVEIQNNFDFNTKKSQSYIFKKKLRILNCILYFKFIGLLFTFLIESLL